MTLQEMAKELTEGGQKIHFSRVHQIIQEEAVKRGVPRENIYEAGRIS